MEYKELSTVEILDLQEMMRLVGGGAKTEPPGPPPLPAHYTCDVNPGYMVSLPGGTVLLAEPDHPCGGDAIPIP